MKAWEYVVLFMLILVMSCSLLGKDNDKKKKNDRYITIEEESDMKEYNKNAVWKKEDCDNCCGTGSVTEFSYDSKKNTMTKTQRPCPYCRGTGYTGMSCK